MKITLKKWIDINADMNLALLQTSSIPLRPRLPSPTVLLFNIPIKGIWPLMISLPTNADNSDTHHKALAEKQTKANKTMIV